MLWLDNKRRISILILILLLLTLTLLGVAAYKPDIRDADIDELIQLEDIGDILAERISSYLTLNPEADINDLIEIDGIGEQRLKILRKCYR